jgi:hypothetical protein
MALLMTAALAALLAGREAIGGAGVVAAAGVKASALLLAPFALLGSERRSRLLAGFAAGAALLAGLGLAVFGSAVDEALKVVGQNQSITSRASVPGTLSRELGVDLEAARTTMLVLLAVALAGLLAWTARGADWVRAAGWGALALLCATSYLTPWYVIWVLPLAALSRDRGLIAATVALSAFLLRHQVPGLGG